MGKQTSISTPANRHNYVHGLDETLKRQQLADILKVNPNVKVNIRAKGGEQKGFTDLPLFIQTTQQKLF
jgi:hypothetical protein